MKIGIIGLGSIGQRHVRCLGMLGYKDIVALRTKKGLSKIPKELGYVKEFYKSEDFYKNKLDGIIVSNPTSLHVEAMKIPLEKGIPLFVEKPISDSLEQLKELNGLDVSKVMVAYCLRYNKIINFAKEFIDSGKLGRVLKARLYCGQYLPLWHPYADYRKEYYSRKDLGGGVLRTLSHEIDLAYYLFGKITELTALVEKISGLEIDVDDNALIMAKTAKNTAVLVELDCLNPEISRNGVIFGSEGRLEYSFSKSTVTFTKYGEKEKIIYSNPKLRRDDMYIEQLRDFIALIKKGKKPRCNYEDGVNVMKVIRAAEESMRTRRWIKVI